MRDSRQMTGEMYIVADPILGWRGRLNYAGFVPEYTDVPIQLDSEGWRELPHRPAQPAMRLSLYGCSYLFGAGGPVNETFAARLQRAFPHVLLVRPSAKRMRGISR